MKKKAEVSCWHHEQETMARQALEAYHVDALRDTVTRTCEHVPLYRQLLDQAGLLPGDITTLDDISTLPLITKNDLRYHYPLDFLAVPRAEVVLVQATSGTSGKPVVVPYTANDLERWSACMARALWAGGLRPGDVCLNAYSYGLFTGGLGFHFGAQAVGSTIIPSSTGMTDRQLVFLRDFEPTALFCTPSYALTIAERAHALSMNLAEFPLRLGYFGAEPWTEEMRQDIERRMGIEAHEVYGLTEMMGPGVAFTCGFHRLHINEDFFYPEIIDPVTERVLPEGEKGELVLTTLQRDAMPLIRYRTGDLTALHRSRCECGRTFVSMDKVMGRTDDMLIISGVHCFPCDIERVLLTFEETGPHYRIRVFKKGHLDAIAVEVEATHHAAAVTNKGAQDLQQRISERLRQQIGIKIPVTLLSPGAIPRSEGKARRIVDERQRKAARND